MQANNPLIKQMQESQESFRKQFDPNSPFYHGGSNVPVPVEGKRIPEQMNTVYPEGFDPNQVPQLKDYGVQYKQVQAQRTVYQNLKKSLAKLGPVIEAFLRHQDIYKQKGDPNNQKHLKTYEDNIKKENTNLENVQTELKAYLPNLKTIPSGQQLAQELQNIIQKSSIKYHTKEALTDFNFTVKKLSAKSFSEAQKCLQKLKNIKKQHANKKEPKQQQSPKEENKPKNDN